MEQLIKKTVKNELRLDDEVKGFVDRATNQIDLDEVLANPSGYLEGFALDLMERLMQKFLTKYVLEGVMFADHVKKSKETLDLNEQIPGLVEVME